MIFNMPAHPVLNQFAETLSSAAQQRVLPLLRHYIDWRLQRDRRGETAFVPKGGDDVELRTYLLELRHQGLSRRELEKRTSALKQFYAWAVGEKLMRVSPFDEFDFDQPTRPQLSADQIRNRYESLPADPVQRELFRLRALNRLAESLNRTADLRTALDVALQVLVETMGLHTAWTFLWDQSGLTSYLHPTVEPHDFVLSAACNLPEGLARNDRHYLRARPDCQCQWLLRSGRLKRAVNVVECTRLQDAAEDDAVAAGDTQGLRFHATVPLIAQGKAVGLINIAAEAWQFFSAGDLQMLTTAGALVAAAIERAWLFARSVELGAVEERNRLAREIHDTLSQGLTAITLQLETADALLESKSAELTGPAGSAGSAEPLVKARNAVQHALTLARSNLDEARRSVLDLRAAPLEGRTLVQALGELMTLAKSGHIDATLVVQGRERALPARTEICLYRIAQEAMNNVLNHAQATQATFSLTFNHESGRESIQLVIEDDGIGFDPAQTAQDRFGLISMNERAKLAGGTLQVSQRSAGDGRGVSGVRIAVDLPLSTSLTAQAAAD